MIWHPGRWRSRLVHYARHLLQQSAGAKGSVDTGQCGEDGSRNFSMDDLARVVVQ
jgi:hypothetical protein